MRRAHRGDHTLSSPRVVIYSTILVATLVPPVYLFVRSFLHRDASDAVVAVVCGVLYLLMLSRLWDVASSQRRAMVRERTLRLAGAALASATSAEEIAAAVRTRRPPWSAGRNRRHEAGSRPCWQCAAMAACARPSRSPRPRPRASPTSSRETGCAS